MNVSGVTVSVIAKVMNIDKADIQGIDYLEDDLRMDDADIEEVIYILEDKLGVDLFEFYDPSECKTVIQLVRFIKKKMEM
jgi:acyl carrier protein